MKLCAHCHSYEKGELHQFGPNLYGIFGKNAASASEFSYCESNQMVDMIWNEENLNNFLQNPTKCKLEHPQTFDPLEKEKDRIDLISFLKCLK